MGTKTSSKVREVVFEHRIPCFSSGLPELNPSMLFSTMKKDGPSGVSARTVRKSA